MGFSLVKFILTLKTSFLHVTYTINLQIIKYRLYSTLQI